MKGSGRNPLLPKASYALMLVFMFVVTTKSAGAQTRLPKPGDTLDEVLKTLNSTNSTVGDFVRVIIKCEEILNRFMAMLAPVAFDASKQDAANAWSGQTGSSAPTPSSSTGSNSPTPSPSSSPTSPSSTSSSSPLMRPLSMPAEGDANSSPSNAPSNPPKDSSQDSQSAPFSTDSKSATPSKRDGKVVLTITLDSSQPIPQALLKAIVDAGANISFPNPTPL